MKSHIVAFFAVALLFVGCSSRSEVELELESGVSPDSIYNNEEVDDPDGIAYVAELDGNGTTQFSTISMPIETFTSSIAPNSVVVHTQKTFSKHPDEKIDKLLKEKLSKAKSSNGKKVREKVIITFEDDLRIPRFPELRATESPNSPFNKAKVAQAKALAKEAKYTTKA